jgi:PAS domain S-box-containing protein
MPNSWQGKAMSQPLRILIVEDSEDDVVLLRRVLRRGGYEVTCEVVETPEAMRSALESQDWDVITSDHAMPHFSAPAALALAKKLRPDIPFIIVSGEINLNLAIALMKGGANDYIQKAELARLVPGIENELQNVAMRREQRKMEETLRRSERDFSTLVENAPDMIVRFDSHLRYIYCNRAVERQLGVPANTLIGKTPLEIGNLTEKNEFIQRALTKVLETGTELEVEQSVPTPTGLKYYQTRIVPERDSQGRIESLLAISRDITEHEQMEDALRESEAQFRAIVEDMPGIVYSFSPKRGGVYYSPRVLDVFGYSPEELYAQPMLWNNSIHPDDLPRIQQIIRETANGKPFHVEYRIRDAYGQWLWFDDRSFRYQMDNGDVIINGLAMDITEHKQAEEALREAHWRMESIIESTRVGTWEWNVQTGETVFNEVWAQIAGYSLAELAPVNIRTWAALAHPEDRQQSDDLLKRHFAGELPYYDYECRMEHKDGHWIWIHDRGQVITRTADGKPLMMFGTHTDITERKLSEMKIRQLNAELERRVLERTRQLEAINKELEAFNYSVSHDLRAPLRRIKIFTQALQDDNNLQSPESLHMIERIVVSVERMNALVEALLKLARFSRSEIKRQAVDLSAMVQRIAAELQQNQPARPVEFVIAEGITVNGDAQLLQIVLENLLDNALKFTAKNASARIEFGLAPQVDGSAACFVRDNGAGFNMEYAHRLFGTFQRLHSEEEFPGIGIGLATVQRIIHRHGGRVWAEGAVGVGAVVYFTVGGT